MRLTTSPSPSPGRSLGVWLMSTEYRPTLLQHLSTTTTTVVLEGEYNSSSGNQSLSAGSSAEVTEQVIVGMC